MVLSENHRFIILPNQTKPSHSVCFIPARVQHRLCFLFFSFLKLNLAGENVSLIIFMSRKDITGWIFFADHNKKGFEGSLRFEWYRASVLVAIGLGFLTFAENCIFENFGCWNDPFRLCGEGYHLAESFTKISLRNLCCRGYTSYNVESYSISLSNVKLRRNKFKLFSRKRDMRDFRTGKGAVRRLVQFFLRKEENWTILPRFVQCQRQKLETNVILKIFTIWIVILIHVVTSLPPELAQAPDPRSYQKPAPETAKLANRSFRKAPTLQSRFLPILERFVPAPKLPGAAELGVLALQGLGAVPVQRCLSHRQKISYINLCAL